VARLKKAKTVKFSQSALETLAIIAYRQPVIRPQIEEIRGVDCGWVLRSLMEKGLVKILGRKDLPGRPIIYGTTRGFLELFNLNSLADLPSLKEIQPPGVLEEVPILQGVLEEVPIPQVLEPLPAPRILEDVSDSQTLEEIPVPGPSEEVLEDDAQAADRVESEEGTKAVTAFGPEVKTEVAGEEDACKADITAPPLAPSLVRA